MYMEQNVHGLRSMLYKLDGVSGVLVYISMS